MDHITETLHDIDARINQLQTIRAGVAGLANPPLAPVQVEAPPAPKTTRKAGLKPPRKPRQVRKAQVETQVETQVGSAPSRARGGEPLRGRKPRGELAAALEAVLPTFGDAWFSVEGCKDALREARPDMREELLGDVCVRLINRASAGQLESQGTGRERRYRNTKPAAAVSYEARKAALLAPTAHH